jgi:surfeit locus 1 family protein
MTARGAFLLALTLMAAGLTARLGLWQLDRAGQKLALQAAIQAQADEPPLGNAALGAPEQLHRRVTLRGRWLSEHTVFLDNRPMEGRVGFFVVTPLQLEGRSESVLVQRGWLPRDAANRSRLPPLPAAVGEVEVSGRLAASPSRLFELGGEGDGAIRQNLDPAAFAVSTGLRLLPLTVVQTAPASAEDTLLRLWPAPDVGLHKHYGYAFQWFALCALILGLYVWFQLLRPRLRQQP